MFQTGQKKGRARLGKGSTTQLEKAYAENCTIGTFLWTFINGNKFDIIVLAYCPVLEGAYGGNLKFIRAFCARQSIQHTQMFRFPL
jgi:hypothetical protein